MILNIQQVLAQNNFAPQFGIPGVPANGITYSQFFVNLFKFIFGLGIVATVVSLIIAGIMYIFAGPAPSLVNKAKKRILMSLIGLIILLASNFIFSQINEELKMPKLKLFEIGELSTSPVFKLPRYQLDIDILDIKLSLLYILDYVKKSGSDEVWVSSMIPNFPDFLIKESIKMTANQLSTANQYSISQEDIFNCIMQNSCDQDLKDTLYNNFYILALAKFFDSIKQKENIEDKVDKVLKIFENPNIAENDERKKIFIETLDKVLGIDSSENLVKKISEKFEYFEILHEDIPSSLWQYSNISVVGFGIKKIFDNTFSNSCFSDGNNNFNFNDFRKKTYEHFCSGPFIKVDIKGMRIKFKGNLEFPNNNSKLKLIRDLNRKIKGNGVLFEEDKQNQEVLLLHEDLYYAIEKAASSSSYIDNELEFIINEAYPPGAFHNDKKHFNGKAIDISFKNNIDDDNNKIEKFSKFIQGLATSSKIDVIVFEYENNDYDFIYKVLKGLMGNDFKNKLTLSDLINKIRNKYSEEFKDKDKIQQFCNQINLGNVRCKGFIKFLFIVSMGYSYRDGKIHYTLIIEDPSAKKIKFATYNTTQGNPLHIESK